MDIVEPALGITLPLPQKIDSVMNKEKVSIKTYEELKAFIGHSGARLQRVPT